MAYQDVTIDFVDRPKAQATKDRAYTLTLKMYSSGTQSVPTSATITIKKPGGAALSTPVDGASVTIDGDGTMTYQIAAGNTGELGANYTAYWYPVVSGVTYDFVQLFDVVRFPLRNVVRQADLTKHHPDLTSTLLSSESNAQTYCAEAFQDVYSHIESKGKRPYLVLSSEDLRRPIEHLTLARYFLPRVKNEGDRWDIYAKHHMQQFELWMQTANFVYDEDDSGTADGTSEYDSESGEEGRNLGVRWRL